MRVRCGRGGEGGVRVLGAVYLGNIIGGPILRGGEGGEGGGAEKRKGYRGHFVTLPGTPYLECTKSAFSRPKFP